VTDSANTKDNQISKQYLHLRMEQIANQEIPTRTIERRRLQFQNKITTITALRKIIRRL